MRLRVFYLLADREDVKSKVAAELESVLSGADPSYDDVVRNLPYLTAVIKEQLRIR